MQSEPSPLFIEIPLYLVPSLVPSLHSQLFLNVVKKKGFILVVGALLKSVE